MTRRLINPTAAITMLTVLLAASAASAQGTCGNWSSGYGTGIGIGPGCAARLAPCAPPLPSYPAGIPSYGSNVYSQSMKLVHQQMAARLAIENKLRAAQVDYELQRPYLTGSDVDRYRQHYQALPEVVRMKLQAHAKIKEIHRCYNREENLKRARRLARENAPRRLSESQYSRLTGAISWPPLLREDERFTEDREVVDLLFAQQTYCEGGPQFGISVEIQKATDRMNGTLQEIIRDREFDATTLAAANTFLKSVSHEARFPAESPDVKVAAK